jgi:GcrA cell cycle regulator
MWIEWTHEQTATLSDMWLANVSVYEMLSTLQAKFNPDLTYKALLARATRMKLPRRRIRAEYQQWPEVAKDRLRVLHADAAQFSASVLALMLNQEFGLSMTRNAVIGQINRLGLPHRVRKAAAPRPPRVPRTRTSDGRVVREVATVPDITDQQIPFEQRKMFLELEPRHCRWPVGDPDEPGFFFCGATRLDDHSYCAGHHRRSRNYTRPAARHFAFPDQRSRFAA